jgi:hypothetical protein
LIVNL